MRKYIEGWPLNAIWAVPSQGIDPMTGREVFINREGKRTYDWSEKDMVYCGQTDPKYRGTVGFNVEYKGFGLSAYGTYEGGCEYYNYTLVERVEDANIRVNVDRRVLQGRWTTPGQNALYTTKRPSYQLETGGSASAATRLTSRFVQKRDEFSHLFAQLLLQFQRVGRPENASQTAATEMFDGQRGYLLFDPAGTRYLLSVRQDPVFYFARYILTTDNS